MKFSRLFSLCASALICTISLAQTSSPTVVTVNGEAVSLSDFEHIYKKNNKEAVITKEDLDEYMNLFINFKLKVTEAEALGMDEDPEFIRELSGYRKQLARPYLVDTELLDEIVLEAHNRQQEEIRARHILVTVSPNAAPADTLRAWNRINRLRNRVLNGDDFETVARAKDGSDDPSAVKNGGDLGWFTAFSMVFAFEEAAYNTPVGELSGIVRTRFGYHFLEVTGRRPAMGEIHVAHIMIKVSNIENKALIHRGKEEIDAVYQLLENGESFESLALKYSADESTKSKGGVLPWFGAGKMEETFSEASFALENDGDYSQPVLTTYGWHIIKRLGYKAPLTFEEAEKALRKKVSRDKRAEVTKTSFINKLKTEYSFRSFPVRINNIKSAASAIDSVFFPEHPLVYSKTSDLGKTLFSINGNNTTVGDFVEFANSVMIRNLDRGSDMIIDELLDRLIEEKLLAYEDSMLEKKYDDFRLLINEYHDGILLFELTDEMVWSKAVKDTAGLIAYHEANTSKFMWGERIEMSAYTCENAEIAEQVKKAIEAGEDVRELRKTLLQENPLAIKIEEGKFPAGVNTWCDAVFALRANDQYKASENGYTIVEMPAGGNAVVIIKVLDFIPPAPKTLEEARGQIIASYQDYLEENWVSSLKEKYTVEVNEEVLYELID